MQEVTKVNDKEEDSSINSLEPNSLSRKLLT
jgi:hypothetical protein